MTELISIWRQHAKGEKFGEFLYMCVVQNIGDQDAESVGDALINASHSDLVLWARERFGIEE